MLAPETRRVWEFLKEQPALAGFVLIGGTALAIRIEHRRSEDLDLAYPHQRLPIAALDGLRRIASQSGFDFIPDDDEAAVQEFANSTLNLRDYQQDFLVNGAVKVSFFAPDEPLAKVLSQNRGAKPRVAELDELFRSKCLVSATRSKTRDWFDLYLLLREHGFSMRDFQKAFQDAGVESQGAIALSRLCGGIPQKDDEGYAHLVSNPPSLLEMKDFFVAQRNLLEIESAEEAMRARRSPN